MSELGQLQRELEEARCEVDQLRDELEVAEGLALDRGREVAALREELANRPLHEILNTRRELAALRESATRGWEQADSLHLTVRDLRRELAEARALLARRQFCRCGCGIFEHDMVSAWEDDVRAFLRGGEGDR